MKSIILVVTLMLAFSIASAETTELVDPGITPDSPFYFADTLMEGIQLSFTFNDARKNALKEDFAEERIAEMDYCLETGQLKYFNNSYEKYLYYNVNNQDIHSTALMTMLKHQERLNNVGVDSAIQNVARMKLQINVTEPSEDDIEELIEEQKKLNVEQATEKGNN